MYQTICSSPPTFQSNSITNFSCNELSSTHSPQCRNSYSTILFRQILDGVQEYQRACCNSIAANPSPTPVNPSITTKTITSNNSTPDAIATKPNKDSLHQTPSAPGSPSPSCSSNDTVDKVHLSSSLFEGEPTPQLLPCKHWLEVNDPHHRYGTYLRPYYDEWRARRECPTEGFFEWLDEGQGQCVDIKASSKRLSSVPLKSSSSSTSLTSSAPLRRLRPRHFVTKDQLDGSVVRYCNEQERSWYQVKVDCDKNLRWANRPGEPPVDTIDDHRWVFVIDEHLKMYMNRKKKAQFHHSSFVAGAPVRAAGRIEVSSGQIQNITPHSGHYLTSMSALRRALFDVFGECCLPIDTLREDSV